MVEHLVDYETPIVAHRIQENHSLRSHNGIIDLWMRGCWAWARGYHCRACGRSADVTIASGSILFVGILPGQQVMVGDVPDDSFYSFFIHVMIMQALSDNVLLGLVRQEASAQPCGWVADGGLSCLSSVWAEIRMAECGGFTRGVGQPEGLIR